jgi:hypothetical protein
MPFLAGKVGVILKQLTTVAEEVEPAALAHQLIQLHLVLAVMV